MDNKVISFNKFLNEDKYTVQEDGTLKKEDWELIKDSHPAKFVYKDFVNEKDTNPFRGDYVWVLKHKGEIRGVFSSELDKDILENMFLSLKS